MGGAARRETVKRVPGTRNPKEPTLGTSRKRVINSVMLTPNGWDSAHPGTLRLVVCDLVRPSVAAPRAAAAVEADLLEIKIKIPI